MPKITVIVPVYRVEQYLRRCTDSILSQSFRDFELVLVDDGCDAGLVLRMVDGVEEKVVTVHPHGDGVIGVPLQVDGNEPVV